MELEADSSYWEGNPQGPALGVDTSTLEQPWPKEKDVPVGPEKAGQAPRESSSDFQGIRRPLGRKQSFLDPEKNVRPRWVESGPSSEAG